MKTNIIKAAIVVVVVVILWALKVPIIFNVLTVLSILLLYNFYTSRQKRINSLMLNSVKIYQGNNFVKEYVLTDTIKKLYYKEYKTTPAIQELEFLDFLNKNLVPSEIITFYANAEKREKFALAAISTAVTESHASQLPSVYHISYYTDTTLNVTDSIDGKLLTKEDITNFSNFLDNNGRKKGDKVYLKDFENWKQSRK